MVKPNLIDNILDFVYGDTFSITRTITGIPTGQTITRAWFTVKSSDVLPDNQALVQKIVDTTDNPGTGQIEDNGAGDGTGTVRFDILPADTASADESVVYLFDIQVETSAGDLYTSNRGTFKGLGQITRATS